MGLGENFRFIQANQALREMFKTDILEADILLELAEELMRIDKFDLAETCLRKTVALAEEAKDVHENVLGDAKVKLGRVFISQNKPEIARKILEEALGHLEGESEKANVFKLLDGLGNEGYDQ